MTRITADWLNAPPTRAVQTLLTDAGHQALFVGGCVRNALLGRASTDIDIATDAEPDQVMALTTGTAIRAVPTGIAHGTVTLVAEGMPFEVTTFRRDVATDGRWAEVAFSTDIAEDAARRDFTMNALYARADGEILDPLGGIDDLRARRVRFVGDPARRIAEDYLRIVRFFRFHAWYGDPEGGIDAEGLAACAEGQDGLDHLSRERIGGELRKLLSAPDPVTSVSAMAATGILTRLLPGADPTALGPLLHLEQTSGIPPRWERRLSVLGAHPDWPDLLRLSKQETRTLTRIAAATSDPPATAAYRHGPDAALDGALIRAASLGAGLPADLIPQIELGASARFPVTAADLALRGPALGAALRRLESDWIRSGFCLSKADLIAASDKSD